MFRKEDLRRSEREEPGETGQLGERVPEGRSEGKREKTVGLSSGTIHQLGTLPDTKQSYHFMYSKLYFIICDYFTFMKLSK